MRIADKISFDYTNHFYGNDYNYRKGSKMNVSAAMIACMSLAIIILSTACGVQDVGGDFGRSWLSQHGMQPFSATESHNGLWDFGDPPKGYTISNGILIPPGSGTQWYYPGIVANSTPIIINNTSEASNNYPVPNLELSIPEDAWLLSQLTGRPIAIVNTPSGVLF
jgi:hypothetical protein